MGASLANLNISNNSASTVETSKEDLKDQGGYISGKYLMGKFNIVYGYGQSVIVDEKDSLADGQRSINTAARVGFDYELDKSLIFFSEITYITTGYWDSSKEGTSEKHG